MLNFTARVKSMSQKFTVDNEDVKKTVLNLSLEIKEGHENVSNMAEYLNSPLEFSVKPIQPGLLPKKE